MRSRALRVAVAAALATATPSLAAGAEAEDAPRFAEHPSGHRFRVSFDPASRVTLGLSTVVARGPTGAPAAAPEIDAGLVYRTASARGEGRDRVAWQVEHRISTGWVRPIVGPVSGVPAMDAALYGVSLHRHDASPSLVLPTSPPVGIPFPFDVGFDAEAGRVSLNAFARGAPVIHVGVVRAALLLDPWRSGVKGRLFTIGIGARYDLDVEGALRGPRDDAMSVLPAPRIVHRVAPMTAGSMRFRIESRDGLSVADARAEVAPHWSSLGTWAFSARANVHLERALIAVSDQPISAVVEGGYRFDPAARVAESTSDFRVSVGLALNLSLPH
ncbi:hypothetical protein A7982_12095 [Minicystis rosea]|nr:hypothetical protein A7982_12095 [Minicystis rosea]